jgi:hypothetical protein
LPGAETIKGGIIGVDCFLLDILLLLFSFLVLLSELLEPELEPEPEPEPLRLAASNPPTMPFTAPLVCAISIEDETLDKGTCEDRLSVSDGVSMWVEVELDVRECVVFVVECMVLPLNKVLLFIARLREERVDSEQSR